MKCVRLLLAAALLAFTFATFETSPAAAREVVNFHGGAPGTIVVRTSERRLYYVIGLGKAIRYPVGVGRVGMQWTGRSYVEGIYMRPAWSPPALVRRDHPSLPRLIPGGAPNNPMGVGALTLNGGEYAIHGTNSPNSVGRFVSYGCIRMYNRDVLDLMKRVYVGTPVLVTR
jgi:lipoprotein-anchoring transpeptidase ErfK/SrfK